MKTIHSIIAVAALVVGSATPAETQSAKPGAVKQARPAEWVYGEVGSLVVNDPAATRDALDQFAPANPVLLHS